MAYAKILGNAICGQDWVSLVQKARRADHYVNTQAGGGSSGRRCGATRGWLLLLAQLPPPGATVNLLVAPKCLVGHEGYELVPEQDYSWDLGPGWLVIASVRQALSTYKHRLSALLITLWCPLQAISFLLRSN